MVYRRRDRPNEGYRTQPKLPRPFGRVGPWQTGFTNRRQAQAVEDWIIAEARTRPQVIEALVRGDFTLRDAWIARVQSTPDRDRVEELIRSATEPTLAEAVEQYKRICTDDRARHGLNDLNDLAAEVLKRRGEVPAKEGVGLSWLREPANVTELYSVAGETRSAGGVRRSIHRAVSELLAHHYKVKFVRDLMLEVKLPKVEDEREVQVTAAEIERLMAVLWRMEPLFHDFVALALLCAVDRAPLLRIAPRYFNESDGTLKVFDTKNAFRARTLFLPEVAVAILRRDLLGLEPDERPFTWTDWQIRHRWEAARDEAAGQPSRNRRERGAAAGLEVPAGVVTLANLRFKDLRHILPTAWDSLGLPRSELQAVMGHAPGSKMTDRYVTGRAGSREHMDQVASALGLHRLHLRAG